MIEIKTAADIYPATEELIQMLRQFGDTSLSAILDHRMHKVSWTTGSELFEELHAVLQNATQKNLCPDQEDLRAQITKLVAALEKYA